VAMAKRVAAETAMTLATPVVADQTPHEARA
jgi:hypothetical protein